MTIHFGFDKKKVIKALRLYFISRREIRFMIILVNVFAILLLIAFVLGYLGATNYIVFCTLWVVLMFFFWFVFPYSVYSKTAMFKHEYSMSFDDQNFSLEHNGRGKSWPWSSLKKYMESPDFFHLYFDSRTFLLVPKDGCKDSDEVHELRMLIKSRVAKG